MADMREENSLMILASVLMVIAFKGFVSPPGGVWKSDFVGNPDGTTLADTKPHKAGQSILVYTQPSRFHQYVILNNIVFLASVIVILQFLLQLSGLRMRGRRWILTRRMIMLVAITALMLMLYVTTPEHVLENSVYLRATANICVVVMLLLSGVAFAGNVAAFMGKMEGWVNQ